MTVPRSIRRLSFVALVLTAACGKEEVETVTHGPVTLDEAQRTTLTRFVGSWQHAGGAAEQEAALASMREVTAQMNGFIRGMAESRLSKTVHIDASLTIGEKDGVATITRSEQPAPFTAPANGTTFDMRTAEGDDGRGSLRIDGDTLVTLVETDKGGGERIYRIDTDGTLVISARTYSPKLPADVKHTARYSKR